MSNYSAYCNGSFKGEKSAVAYIIFKDGYFLEEHVTRHNLPQNNTFLRQQAHAVRLLVDRLVELGAEDVVIHFSCKEVHDRTMKAYNKYVIKKDAHSPGFEKSAFFKTAQNLSKFKSFKLNVIPTHENLRTQFLSRRFIVEHWEPRHFYWKGEYPQQN